MIGTTLRKLSLTLGIGLAAVLAPATALADCPGGYPSCPYSSVSQIGARGGGVLRFPQAVAVGPDGSVYVGDQSSHAVQVFSSDGSFQREVGIPGSRPGELFAIGAVAVSQDGSLFVADGATNRITRFDQLGRFYSYLDGLPGSRFRFGPGGGHSSGAGGALAVSDDRLYVADTANDRILRFKLDWSEGREIVPPGMLANPRGLAVRKTRLAVADDQNHRVVVFDTGGKVLKTVGAGQGSGLGQLSFPYDVAFDSAGRLFVADDMNHRVVSYGAPNYKYRARWGAFGTAPGRLAFPRGIAVDKAGLVYVTNTGNDRIDVFERSGHLVRSFGISGRGPGQFNTPVGIATDANGYRAVADSLNGRIQFLNGDGTVATAWGTPNPGPTILKQPVDVSFDGAGNAFVLDQRLAKIFFFDRSTGLPGRTIADQGRGSGELYDPSAMAIDRNGLISVADSGNRRITRFTTTGAFIDTFAVPDTPRGVATAPDGSRTYVSDARHRITVYGPGGNRLLQFGGLGTKVGKLNSPSQMTIDGNGNLWVVDSGNNRIQIFGPQGERLAAFGQRGTGLGQFIRPSGVSISCNGTVTVTERANNRLQQFTVPGTPNTCVALPALGTPPPPRVPSGPRALGPELTLSVIRRTSVLRSRTLPVRVGCDTICSLEVSGSLTPRARPKKSKPVYVKFAPQKVQLGAGESKTVRLRLSAYGARRLSASLRRLKGMRATVNLSAVSNTGEGSSQPRSLIVTR